MDRHLRWELLNPQYAELWVIRIGMTEVARVNQRVNGGGWLSSVARHRRHQARPMMAIARSKAAAMRWAMRWTLIHYDTVVDELPQLMPNSHGKLIWPASNPPAPGWH